MGFQSAGFYSLFSNVNGSLLVVQQPSVGLVTLRYGEWIQYVS